MSVHKEIKRVTTHVLAEMKLNGEKISMLTAYDYSMAKLVDQAGIDVILVGDSASNVMAGNETTLPITLDQMIYHGKSVVKGVTRCLVVVDMPFGTYQGNSLEALNSAIRIMKITHADAVKLEGGSEIIESVTRILSAGIPVMGHLGLTPQSVMAMGGYKVQGRSTDAADALVTAARAIEDAGCFAVVLEGVPDVLATAITAELTIPTIGIGAGPGTDGQVLVFHDLLGMSKGTPAKFVRRYLDLGTQITDAVSAYVADVRAGAFPAAAETYGASSELTEHLEG